MDNLLAAGAAWLANQLQTHAASEVRYVRGADEVLLCATIGKTEFEVDDGAGTIERFQSRDFLLRASDLVLAGSQTLPQAGDLIHETQGAQTFVYEVMSPGEAPPWRYSDPFRNLLRVHTKHVGG
ncbi:MAG: hypothetical protein RIC55_02475 [Pirellulaceae bacterium]